MIRKIATLMIALILISISCKENEPGISMSEEKLTSVIIDLEYAKAATHGQSAYLKDSMMVVYKEQICQIHGITSEKLEKNLQALEEDQELLERLLRNARDSLEI